MSSDRSNDYSDEKIVEDTPRMRSVSMMTASPSQTLIREAPSLVKRFNSVPEVKSPPIVLATPAKVPSLPPTWAISALPCIPLYYQLERTHAKVSAEPAVVAQRVSDCLRNQSMSTVYNDDEVRDCIVIPLVEAREDRVAACMGKPRLDEVFLDLEDCYDDSANPFLLFASGSC
jgi:hypothetical protein